jgi:hypothetical protein
MSGQTSAEKRQTDSQVTPKPCIDTAKLRMNNPEMELEKGIGIITEGLVQSTT